MQLNISLTQRVLIDLAKTASGMELQAMAAELGYDKSRVNKWKSGDCKMSPTEVLYFTDKAQLDFEETLGDLEVARDPKTAELWSKLSKSRQKAKRSTRRG